MTAIYIITFIAGTTIGMLMRLYLDVVKLRASIDKTRKGDQ